MADNKKITFAIIKRRQKYLLLTFLSTEVILKSPLLFVNIVNPNTNLFPIENRTFNVSAGIMANMNSCLELKIIPFQVSIRRSQVTSEENGEFAQLFTYLRR